METARDGLQKVQKGNPNLLMFWSLGVQNPTEKIVEPDAQNFLALAGFDFFEIQHEVEDAPAKSTLTRIGFQSSPEAENPFGQIGRRVNRLQLHGRSPFFELSNLNFLNIKFNPNL
ncbi:MAG: hypothetical protein COV31_02995 [Candidatus Yanofskybacteria bacterium CG10_big_fil_rev_8_21_14_0_10_46_23]|uniref:Uncharacterized protein n=1 Tax=Candidatus Yanofskybacteria bacterium CG10_big_fil_rev_8_21_14_0_10_46_23 TaxID=1975098 RepID=A0A2H0R3I8_9BACT|nr:MAG: hypothetical protein COV31_02995 [Candidatus Yanofskybacteria bacterium CG10_big_fil_rev_8_21_14_0_10_46_23]